MTMTTDLQSNLKYKTPGADWLGNIPAEWNTRKMKFLFSLLKRPVQDEDEIITAFRDGVVTLRKNRREEGFTIALQESGYQGVHKGDLVIHSMDGFAGAIGVSDSNGKATPVYSICSPKNGEVVPRYYAYLLRTLALSGFITSLARGIRERSTEFKWNVIANLNLILLPLETQKQIADFLDEKTKVIDALIEKKDKLIELLREKRAVLITHAVTKGLNPRAKLKSSGVEWLGKMPAEWEVKKIKFAVYLYAGDSISDDRKSEFSTEIEGYPYISSKDINLNYNIINYENGMHIPKNNKDFKVAVKESILLCIEGGSAGRKIGYTNQNVCFVNKLCCIKSRKENNRFIYYFCRSKNFQDFFELNISGLIGGVSLQRLKDFHCLLPNNIEQKQIADFLDAETEKIDKAVALIESQIEKLKEYRSSLIYHAVTGKIKM